MKHLFDLVFKSVSAKKRGLRTCLEHRGGIFCEWKTSVTFTFSCQKKPPIWFLEFKLVGWMFQSHLGQKNKKLGPQNEHSKFFLFQNCKTYYSADKVSERWTWTSHRKCGAFRWWTLSHLTQNGGNNSTFCFGSLWKVNTIKHARVLALGKCSINVHL